MCPADSVVLQYPHIWCDRLRQSLRFWSAPPLVLSCTALRIGSTTDGARLRRCTRRHPGQQTLRMTHCPVSVLVSTQAQEPVLEITDHWFLVNSGMKFCFLRERDNGLPCPWTWSPPYTSLLFPWSPSQPPSSRTQGGQWSHFLEGRNKTNVVNPNCVY